MDGKRLGVLEIQEKQRRGEKIVMVTAYDSPLAQLADEAGIDIILVSDALGMVGLGYASTIPVTMEDMLHHTKAVVRGARRSLVVTTMPFLAANLSPSDTLRNAGKLVQEGGATGVEVEGGLELLPSVEAMAVAGIPVLSHIGLTRQFFSRYGRFKVQGRNGLDALAIVNLARDLQNAGAFAILLECVPDKVAEKVTQVVDIPTIGIGAGPYCDGQALVSQDLLGLFEGFLPRFAKRYAHLSEDIRAAFGSFRDDVQSGSFPATEHTFRMESEELDSLTKLLADRG
jgi:3-methyl-2-oxobutanoate hydroxymethyltransferase